MIRIKYLFVFCIIVVLTAVSIKSLQVKYDEMIQEQNQMHKDIIASAPASPVVIDSSILIDDHEKPIVPPPKPVIPKPYVTAESYLVANLETGEKYLQLNPNKVTPIASVSKLYTALVVDHLFDPKSELTVTQAMLDAYGDAGHLVMGEKFTPEELLPALLLESSNDAAEVFAQSYGYEKFMNEMNGFAQEIGMHNTSFQDSSGLSPYNFSSANDLFTLARYLYTSEISILEVSRTQVVELATTTEHSGHTWININPFTSREDFIGGKTGRTTEAKEAMVSIFKQTVNNKVYPIVVIILRSDFGERETNTEKLLGLFVDKISR